MGEFFNTALFDIWGTTVAVWQVALGVLLFILSFFAFWLISYRLAPRLFKKVEVDKADRRKIRAILGTFFFLTALLGLLFIFGFDRLLLETAKESAPQLKVSTILEALIIWQLARLLDLVISKVIMRTYYEQKEEKAIELDHYQTDTKKRANRMVQYVVYVFALLFIVQAFDINPEFFTYPPAKGQTEGTPFTLVNILNALFILLVARMLSWVVIQFVLKNYYRRKNINVGSQYAINQLLQYFVYVIAILMALEALGFSITVLWGGAAALLVGIGLGLQETFKDLFSGIIMLFERRVEVGDVVEVDGLIGIVRRIGVRTSLVETRDNITVIVPNSKLIVEKVINWSHFDNKARFFVRVGVAYGSDTELVKKILLNVARENAFVLRHPPPFVRFVDFGDSSLDFQIHFWSHEFIRIEDVKSDIRFEIDQAFRKNGVTIPFPQRDVWMRGGEQ
ncbi:MAG: mechanosensitive ion channel [Phaeodactylibacter sp.]|nr:mechanosensitive ion channel [Phaeodactylibacter sp.]